MNYTKEDIEYYLIHKEYQELTPDELGFISSEVKSEKEFNQLKSLMLSLFDNKTNEPEIEPDPALKSVLMKKFSEKSKINKIWYNTLLIQLFPKEKSIYQMPGIQLAGVAASLLLIINIFLLNDPIKKENQVAVNNESKTEKTITVNNENGADDLLKTSSNSENNKPEIQPIELPNNEIKLSDKEILTDIDIPEEAGITNELVMVFSDEIEEDVMISEERYDGNLESTALDSTTSKINFLGDSDNKDMIHSKEEENESLTLEGFTEPTVNAGNIFDNTAIEEMEINSEMRSVETSKGRVRNKNTIVKSRSLDDDKELIELFFTAL